MKIFRGRFLALLLALVMLLPAQPGGLFAVAGAESPDASDSMATIDNTGEAATAEPATDSMATIDNTGVTATADPATVRYGMTTASGVNVRKNPSTSASSWFQLDQEYICTIEDEMDNENIHWYHVIVVHPSPESKRTYIGYIHGDYFRPLTEQETSEYLYGVRKAEEYASVTATPTVDTSGTNIEVYGVSGVVTNGGTNFREGPSMKSHSIMKLDRGTMVQVTSVPETVDENHWYGIYYAGYYGYIRSDFLRVTGTGSVTASPTATPTPGVTGSVELNAVQLILTSCHLRTSPGGSFDSSKDWEGKWSILPLAGTAVNKDGYLWYPVLKDGNTYYVRSDCVQLVYVGVTPTPTAYVVTPTPEWVTPTPTSMVITPTPAPTSGNILGYVMTIKGGCNLRTTIGGTVIKQIAKYRTLPYLLAPVNKNGYTWYYVEVDGLRGYLRSDVVKVVDATVTPTVDPTVTQESSAAGYVMTIASDVNLRTKAGYYPTKGRVAKGVIMPYYGSPSEVKGVTWYYVFHNTLGYGWIHGNYVRVVNADGSPTATPTGGVPTATGGGVPTATSSGKKEASYTTLRLGSTGTAVRNLVTALKNQGFYSGEITTRYTSAVMAAVKLFQEAKGLTVDGIAGAATQHALYGTVPYGSEEQLSITLYAAEKIDWWTGGINEMWVKGTNYKIYDVKTGIVWWAHRWSGGYHVDAEPLTASDTAKLCKCYGVTTSSEIASKNLYERRPCLITIGTRTFACSLYGVPHNYPEGDTISDNEFKGQLCIHFTNSWTHGSKKVDSLHTEAIQYAWEHAPNGHK